MSAPRDLRGKLSRSEFFSRIGTGNCGDEDETQLILANSTTLFGIDQNKDQLIQLSLAGCSNISNVCAAPIHCIDHITQATDGSLALWSALGVSVLKGPVKPGGSLISVNVRLGQSFIKSVKWLGADLFVLSSSNEVLLFKNKNFASAIELSFADIPDSICDFLPVETKDGGTEILTIASNGFLRVDQDILMNVEIEGDLKMASVGKDCVVIANNQMAAHTLILNDEAFIVEKVELDLFESANAIAIIADNCCLNRYFIYSNSGVNCVTLDWLEEVQKSGTLKSEQSSTVENLISGSAHARDKITGVTLISTRIPNSPSFDGPVLCCSLSSGGALVVPLLSLPVALQSSNSNQNKNKAPPVPNIVEKLKKMLEKKPTRMLPTNGASLPLQEQIETAARIINCLRKEHLARGVAVREAIQSETQLIRKTQTDQDSKLKHLEIQKQNTREKAENIAEKFESIVHKQSQIEERLVNILVNLSSGEMSMVEKNAAKELRETARQVSKLEKSVDRVKVLSSKVQPIKAASGPGRNQSFMKPLSEANERIDHIISSIKSLQVEAGL